MTVRKLTGPILALLAAVTACGIVNTGPGGAVNKDAERQQQFQELMQRPDIDQATARYEQMRTEIRDRLTAEIGMPQWKEGDSATSAGCNDFPAVELADKQSDLPSTWVSRANISDEKWSRAVEILDGIARNYGFESPPRTIVDRPGDHEVTVADEFGADLIFGTKGATILSLLTGCHLRAEAHRRGTPTIPQYGR